MKPLIIVLALSPWILLASTPYEGEKKWIVKSVESQGQLVMVPAPVIRSVTIVPGGGSDGTTSALPVGDSRSGGLKISGQAFSLTIAPELPITEACYVMPATGVFCIPNPDPEFSATFLSVCEQESGCRPDAYRIATINGVDYEVRGCAQILLDAATRPLIASLGFTLGDMYDCGKNATVAQAWWRRTGSTWRMWVAKPTYRTDGHDAGLTDEDRWWER